MPTLHDVEGSGIFPPLLVCVEHPLVLLTHLYLQAWLSPTRILSETGLGMSTTPL